MRKALGAVLGQADHLEQLTDPRLAIGLTASDVQRLGDRLTDPHARVQRGLRVLEDELQPGPNGGQVGLAICTGDVTAEQLDAAGGRL